MDTTKTATHVSLCAGYGGIDLGLKRAIPSLRTIAFSEIEAFACANLVAKMEAGHLDPAPIWTDVKTFPYASFHGKVDILSGGYPCQPFSAAGKRLGADDPRHLWPFIADGVAAMRPEWCFFENVEGHISLGLPNVIEDVAGMGYRTAWGIFSAAECGAPHQRKRVFILAHRNDARLEGRLPSRVADPLGREEPGNGHFGPSGYHGSKLADASNSGWWQDRMPPELRANVPKQSSSHSGFADQTAIEQVWPSRPGELQFEWEPPRVVADTNGKRGQGPEHQVGDACQNGQGRAHSAKDRYACDWPSRPGEPQFGWEPPRVVADTGESGQRQAQPSLGRDADGPARRMDYAQLRVACDNRTDELRLLGNGVVPATAALAFRTLLTQLDHDFR